MDEKFIRATEREEVFENPNPTPPQRLPYCRDESRYEAKAARRFKDRTKLKKTTAIADACDRAMIAPSWPSGDFSRFELTDLTCEIVDLCDHEKRTPAEILFGI